ncbi:MAG: hypothetical protein KJT03_01445, partial [Verrucomicrobiae bacterium]|nr:hypothetical protein [Verrucomicrobiae bacterium]
GLDPKKEKCHFQVFLKTKANTGFGTSRKLQGYEDPRQNPFNLYRKPKACPNDHIVLLELTK